eukprot:Skav232162  [mRNA]  locus=scaffold1040:535869:538586:- [translate_table: standard]
MSVFMSALVQALLRVLAWTSQEEHPKFTQHLMYRRIGLGLGKGFGGAEFGPASAERPKIDVPAPNWISVVLSYPKRCDGSYRQRAKCSEAATEAAREGTRVVWIAVLGSAHGAVMAEIEIEIEIQHAITGESEFSFRMLQSDSLEALEQRIEVEAAGSKGLPRLLLDGKALEPRSARLKLGTWAGAGVRGSPCGSPCGFPVDLLWMSINRDGWAWIRMATGEKHPTGGAFADVSCHPSFQ